MSVLIKGVDMPKVCADCPCFYDNICCNALPYGEGAFSDHKGFDEYDGRLPNCPLVEVDGEKMDEEEPRYCDRNLCYTNEVNGIGCDECPVMMDEVEDDRS